jgi:hypothetical protein
MPRDIAPNWGHGLFLHAIFNTLSADPRIIERYIELLKASFSELRINKERKLNK